ncbi:hypothetical protein ACMD2_24931, partial [Ananas comosus]
MNYSIYVMHNLQNHFEHIIGILKMRFSILKITTFNPIESQTNIVIASCVLHNFIRIHNASFFVGIRHAPTEGLLALK